MAGQQDDLAAGRSVVGQGGCDCIAGHAFSGPRTECIVQAVHVSSTIHRGEQFTMRFEDQRNRASGAIHQFAGCHTNSHRGDGAGDTGQAHFVLVVNSHVDLASRSDRSSVREAMFGFTSLQCVRIHIDGGTGPSHSAITSAGQSNQPATGKFNQRRFGSCGGTVSIQFSDQLVSATKQFSATRVSNDWASGGPNRTWNGS